MRGRRAAAGLVLALLAYAALLGSRGVYLLGQHPLTLRLLGGAVLLLPLVALVAAAGEVRFGLAAQRLGARLGGEPDPPGPLPLRPSGRPERAAADAVFTRRRDEVRADPADWRRWYRLALAYDDAGDRRRARAAMRTAIARAGGRA